MKTSHPKRKYVSQKHYTLQPLEPAQVRPMTWKYAHKLVDAEPYTHMQRLGSADGAGSRLQVALAIVLGIFLLPALAGLPLVIGYLAG